VPTWHDGFYAQNCNPRRIGVSPRYTNRVLKTNICIGFRTDRGALAAAWDQTAARRLAARSRQRRREHLPLALPKPAAMDASYVDRPRGQGRRTLRARSSDYAGDVSRSRIFMRKSTENTLGQILEQLPAGRSLSPRSYRQGRAHLVHRAGGVMRFGLPRLAPHAAEGRPASDCPPEQTPW
jgi:hypothetical protein